MDKAMLLNEKLPLVTEYDDRYEKTDLNEVLTRAEADDPAAMYELAHRYRCGCGGAVKDNVKAMQMYNRVLQFQRNTKAMYCLAFAYSEGTLGKEQIEECIPVYEAAIELGNGDSAVQLGLIYEFGDIVPQDYDKALKLYLFAIDHGRKDAYFYAGEIYRYQSLHEKAIEYYSQAIKYGELQAALPMGWYYERGVNVAKDYKKAFVLYKKAYEDGNPSSTFYLGRMYYLGLGTDENDAEAFRLFSEASQNGYKDANCFLGRMYGYGVQGVVESNTEKAIEYLSDVSEDYEVDAWYNKGCIYANAKQMDDAMLWLKKAAEAGDERAEKVIRQIQNPQEFLRQEAEEGKDPNAMIRYAALALSNPEQGGFTKAVETITRANQLFPDDLNVKEAYARYMFLKGHVDRKIGADNDAYRDLMISVETVDQLKQRNFMPDAARETEVDACMELAEMAYRRDEVELTLRMLERTDMKKYPYAVVLKAIVHFGQPMRYGSYISDDISGIHSTLGTSKWREPFEEASAYYVLSIIYAYGVSGYVQANVPYAYECIQKCAVIDSELAAPELKKYSKGFLGKVTYRK
mgnify:CR=1 FL=1